MDNAVDRAADISLTHASAHVGVAAPAIGGNGERPHAHGEHHVPVHYARGTGGRAVMFAFVVLLALGALFVYRKTAQQKEEAALDTEIQQTSSKLVAVDVVHIKPAAGEKLLILPGDTRAYYDATIFARTSGYLKEIMVDIGDHVTDGQVLATIETPDLDDQLVAVKAKLDELKAQVHVAETTLSFAKVSFQRWDADDGSVSKQERDQKKSELDAAVAKLEAARAQVALGQADVQRLETIEKFKEVRAPFSGTVTERHVDPGELITAGSTSNTTPLFKIVRIDKVRVMVDVPQNLAPEIKSGMVAVATYAGREFPGTVERTSSSIDMISRTLKVEVVIPNPDHALLPGAHLQVALHAARGGAQLQVPASALMFRTKGPQVAVVARDGRVSFKDVHITRDSGDFVEVDGLDANEMVALNLSNSVMSGDAVEARDLDAKTASEMPKPAASPKAPSQVSESLPRAAVLAEPH